MSGIDRVAVAKPLAVRHACVLLMMQLHGQSGSLATLLPDYTARVPERDRALLQQLCFGLARYAPWLSQQVSARVSKPLRNKDRDIEMLLRLGIYQLAFLRLPQHAVINLTVATAAELKKGWARGLTNAVLRRFQRDLLPGIDPFAERLQQPDLPDVVRYCQPQWLIDLLRTAWPDDYVALLQNTLERAPMTLRVNTQRSTGSEYLAQLQAADVAASLLPSGAVVLQQPLAVEQVPGFAQGVVSVQDAAAQLAAPLLHDALRRQAQLRTTDAPPRVLDACAAPGGKTAHLLEIDPALELTAIDNRQKRLDRVTGNLQRLQLPGASLICADAAQTADWWDGDAYDAVLLDAPCSGTGVIRRQPDISLLRRPEDVDNLVDTQARLLLALWGVLRDGGVMLYATCSVLPAENALQMHAFLASHDNAVQLPIVADDTGKLCVAGHGTATGDEPDRPAAGELSPADGRGMPCGYQILTGDGDMDGFYFCLLQKRQKRHKLQKRESAA